MSSVSDSSVSSPATPATPPGNPGNLQGGRKYLPGGPEFLPGGSENLPGGSENLPGAGVFLPGWHKNSPGTRKFSPGSPENLPATPDFLPGGGRNSHNPLIFNILRILSAIPSRSVGILPTNPQNPPPKNIHLRALRILAVNPFPPSAKKCGYGHWDEFHALACHMVPANGKNHLIHPVAIANKMNIPYFLVFDCDGDCRAQDRPKHEPDNKTLLSLVGAPIGDGFPAAGVTQANCRAWANNMGKAIEADFVNTDLCGYMQKARQVCGGAKSLTKNSMFITEWLTNAHEDGKKSVTLENLCLAIIASGK